MQRAGNSVLAGLGIAALTLASGDAQSEVTSTVTIASEYDFRGVTQTALDPAFQASLDWSGESGWYAGIWGSNIDFGNYIPERTYPPAPGIDPDPALEESVDLNVEVDVMLGYAGSFTEDLGYDVGATYYKYLGGGNHGDNDFDYFEIYGELSYTMFAATLSPKVWYALDYVNSGDSAWYAELNVDYPLPAGLGLVLHYGYSGGDYWDSEYDGGYYDFAVGLTRSFGHFNFVVKYIDGSDLKDADCSRSSVSCGGDPVFSSQSVFFASVSTTFPWTTNE
jgi:uncharacterized protein (TIGR02001 family)